MLFGLDHLKMVGGQPLPSEGLAAGARSHLNMLTWIMRSAGSSAFESWDRHCDTVIHTCRYSSVFASS